MESEEAPVHDEQYFDELPFGGYDFVFVDEPSPGQTCSICLTAMRNPVQTFCGHRFCEECFLGTFREGHHQVCPQDRYPIPHEEGFFRDVAWERDILSLRVKCKVNERGCDWMGQLRNYESHSYECKYKDVVCGDCNQEMQRRFLDKHLTECRERIVQCTLCEEEFAFWRLKHHEDEECTHDPLKFAERCRVQSVSREECANEASTLSEAKWREVPRKSRLTTKGAQTLPSGNWQGYFIDGREFGRGRASGSKWPINVIMSFQNGNQFTGKGQDEIGPFIFTNGKISGSSVQFVKQYATHKVLYNGEVKEGKMMGHWRLEESFQSIKGEWKMWPVGSGH